MSSLPKTVTRQRRGCDLYSGPSAPESSTLNTRLPSVQACIARFQKKRQLSGATVRTKFVNR